MFRSILVGTDGSETAHAALARGIELAVGLQARLHIVMAYEPVPDARPREAAAQAVALLERAQAEAVSGGVSEVETFARVGDAADAIVDVAEEQRCDLIVVGNKGMTGAKRFLLGSVPNKVSHHAPCSVLIVRTT